MHIFWNRNHKTLSIFIIQTFFDKDLVEKLLVPKKIGKLFRIILITCYITSDTLTFRLIKYNTTFRISLHFADITTKVRFENIFTNPTDMIPILL